MRELTTRATLYATALIEVAAVLVAGCGGGGPAIDAATPKGRESFLANCALCHGSEGEGRSRLGKALQDNAFVNGLGDEELLQFLKDGRSSSDPANESGVDMPPKGGNPDLTDEDLMEIVAYLRTL